MQELVSFIVSFSVQKTLKAGMKGTSYFTQHVGLIGDNELMILSPSYGSLLTGRFVPRRFVPKVEMIRTHS